MSKGAILEYAEMIEGSEQLQDEIQPYLNDFAGALVETGDKHDCDVSVDEVGAFLAETFFIERQYPQNKWTRLFSKLVDHIKVTDANSDEFATMDFGSMDAGMLAELHAADVVAATDATDDDESAGSLNGSPPPASPETHAIAPAEAMTADVSPRNQTDTGGNRISPSTRDDVPERAIEQNETDEETDLQEEAAPWNAEPKPWWKFW